MSTDLPRSLLTACALPILLACSSPSEPAAPSGPTAVVDDDAAAPPTDLDAATPRDGGLDSRPTARDASGPSDAAAGDAAPSAKDGGLDPSLDRKECLGPASASGTVRGTSPQISVGMLTTDSGGGVRAILLPKPAISSGDVVVALYFTPIQGQLSYPPNGATGCAVLRYTGADWAVVDKSQMCELSLAELSLASAAGACDGTVSGTYRAVMAANATLSGAFVLPTDVAWSQIRTSCHPMNAICAKHADCCSGSCSRFIGVCN